MLLARLLIQTLLAARLLPRQALTEPRQPEALAVRLPRVRQPLGLSPAERAVQGQLAEADERVAVVADQAVRTEPVLMVACLRQVLTRVAVVVVVLAVL